MVALFFQTRLCCSSGVVWGLGLARNSESGSSHDGQDGGAQSPGAGTGRVNWSEQKQL